MVFAARKKQLIAIQFKYFGRAYSTEQQRSYEYDMKSTCNPFWWDNLSPRVWLPMQHILDQQADLQLCHLQQQSVLHDVRNLLAP